MHGEIVMNFGGRRSRTGLNGQPIYLVPRLAPNIHPITPNTGVMGAPGSWARTWGTRGKLAIMVAFRRWRTNWQRFEPRMTTGAFEFLGTRAKALFLLHFLTRP